MSLTIITILFFLSSLEPYVNGLGCMNCTITPVLTLCPDRSIGGVFCNDTCFVLNRTCPTTPLPTQVVNNCTSCPAPVPTQANYICADGMTIGGPYCDITSCTWLNRTCTPANFTRSGDCPVVDSSVNCTGLVADRCNADFDCTDGQKCCSSSCGRQCLTAILNAPQTHSGFCPVVTVVITPNITCPQTCSFDGNCTSTQKCCLNQCGGLTCKTSVSSVTCNLNACGPVPSGFPAFCPDGSSTGPFCQSVGGICKWAFRTCSNFTRLIHNDGTCPAFVGTSTNCSSQCDGDDMCDASKKCCFNGCPSARICTSSVQQKCVATDFRGMRCLDESTAAQLFAKGLPSAPSDGIYFPEACYRCVENAVCASNGTDCHWSTTFKQCLDTCSNPSVNVSLPCSGRSLCGCLNTPATCSWCQYSQMFTDSGSNVTIPMGRCMSNSIADKCTGDLSSGGYMGNLIRVKPTDCTSSSINPNVVDPSSLLSDSRMKQIITQVSDGSFSATGLQQALYQLGVNSLIIRDISPPHSNANFGYILFTFDNLAGLTNDQVMGYLNQALSNQFTLNLQQISTQILPSSGLRPRSEFSSFLAIASVTASVLPPINPVPSVLPPLNPAPSVLPPLNPAPSVLPPLNPAPSINPPPSVPTGGLICNNCTITPVLTQCQDGSFGGVFCNDSCSVRNRTCPTVQLPSVPLLNCTTCPSPVPTLASYLCADKTIGGPYCNRTSCTWQTRNCTKAIFTRPGECPADINNVICTGLVSDRCSGDIDCTDGQKCCSSSCGTRCLAAVLNAPQTHSGFCPVVTVVNTNNATCTQNCSFDANCTSSQKCCLNECGGFVCKSSVISTNCSLNACGPVPSSVPSCCPDGSSTGPFCQSVSGICKWVYRTCTNYTNIINHGGFCPVFSGTTTQSCSNQCNSDDDCDASKKCCFNGCSSGRVCTSSVPQSCVATDFRGMRCLDGRVATQLFPNGLPSAPSDGVYFPEACYRCVENAVCASNGTVCQWSTAFKQCLDTCSNPTVNVSLPCTGRSLCGCLTAPDTCSWCQYSQNFTDSKSGESYTPSMGRCIQNSIANKCTGDLSSGGYKGNLIRVKPTDCTSTDISPNVVDPSALISDAQIANIIKQVSDGSFTELGFQRILNQLNVKNIIIRDISPPCTDGTNGKILFTFDNFDQLTNDQIVEYLIQALSNNFNLNRNQITIQILPASSSTQKRQTGSSSTSLAISDISALNGTSPSVNPSPSTNQQPGSNVPAPAITPNSGNTNPAPGAMPPPPSSDGNVSPPPPGGSAGVNISPLWFLSMLMVFFWM